MKFEKFAMIKFFEIITNFQKYNVKNLIVTFWKIYFILLIF